MIWTILHHLRKRRQLDQSDQLEHAAEHGHHSPWLRAGEDIRSSRRNPASFCTAFITHVFHTSLECVSQQINSSAVNTQHCDNWNSLADSIMLPHNAVWYTTVSETSIGKTAFTALQYHPFAIIFTANHKRYTAYRTAVSVHWTFKTSKGRSLRSVENHSPPTGKDFLPGSSCVKHRKQADWTETDKTNKKITYARVCVIGFQTLWMSSQPRHSTTQYGISHTLHACREGFSALRTSAVNWPSAWHDGKSIKWLHYIWQLIFKVTTLQTTWNSLTIRGTPPRHSTR